MSILQRFSGVPPMNWRTKNVFVRNPQTRPGQTCGHYLGHYLGHYPQWLLVYDTYILTYSIHVYAPPFVM